MSARGCSPHEFDEHYFRGVLVQAAPKYSNWLLLAAHIKRIVNALFAYGRDMLKEDWTVLPLPDANSIAKWLFLASDPASEDPLMTPRTRNIGTSNLLMISFLLLRVYAKVWAMQMDPQLLEALFTIFSNIDSVLGAEGSYKIDEPIAQIVSNTEKEDEDDCLVERVEKALCNLELSIEGSTEVESLKGQLEVKEREVKALRQQLLNEEKENQELNKSLEQIRRFNIERPEKMGDNDIQTSSIVLNEWFDKKTVDSAAMTCQSMQRDAGVECMEEQVRTSDFMQRAMKRRCARQPEGNII